MIAVALSLSLVLTEHRVPAALVQFVQAYIDSPITFIVAVNLMLLMVGLRDDDLAAWHW